MSPPPKIWGKPFSFQGYFHFYCKMSRLKSTTLKPIYGFWANGEMVSGQMLTFPKYQFSNFKDLTGVCWEFWYTMTGGLSPV